MQTQPILEALIETLGLQNWEHFEYKKSEFSEYKQTEIDKNLLKYIEDYSNVVFDESRSYFLDDNLILPKIFPWVGNCEDSAHLEGSLCKE